MPTVRLAKSQQQPQRKTPRIKLRASNNKSKPKKSNVRHLRNPDIPLGTTAARVQVGDQIIRHNGPKEVHGVERYDNRMVLVYSGYAHYYRFDAQVEVLRP